MTKFKSGDVLPTPKVRQASSRRGSDASNASTTTPEKQPEINSEAISVGNSKSANKKKKGQAKVGQVVNIHVVSTSKQSQHEETTENVGLHVEGKQDDKPQLDKSIEPSEKQTSEIAGTGESVQISQAPVDAKLDEASLEQWTEAQLESILAQKSPESVEVIAAKDFQNALKQAFRAYEATLAAAAAEALPPPPPPPPEFFDPEPPVAPSFDIPAPPSAPDDLPGPPGPPGPPGIDFVPGPFKQGVDRLPGFVAPPSNLRLKPLKLTSEDIVPKDDAEQECIWKGYVGEAFARKEDLHTYDPKVLETFSYPPVQPKTKAPVEEIKVAPKEVVKAFQPFSDDKEALGFALLLLDEHLRGHLANPALIGKGLLEMSPDMTSEETLLSLKKLLINKNNEVVSGLAAVQAELDRDKHTKLDKAGAVLKSLLPVPNLKNRLDACLFKAQFKSKMREICDALAQCEQATDNVFAVGLEGGALLRVLLLVRQYGNLLNYKPNKSDVFGVKIGALKNLSATRSAKSDYTFFNAICEMLTQHQKEVLIEMLAPCRYVKEIPNFKASLATMTEQLKSFRRAATAACSVKSSPTDRFEEVWDAWENEFAKPQLTSEDLITRINSLASSIAETEKYYCEPPGGFANVLVDLGNFVSTLMTIKPPPPPKPVKGETPKSGWASLFERKNAEAATVTPTAPKPSEGKEKEVVFTAKELAPRQFVRLSKIRDNWLVAKKLFLNPNLRSDYHQRTNGLQACFATLKSLYDMDHPRWNKVKHLVDVGLVKATLDCGNTSVSMGLAVQFFAANPGHHLVAFLNGGTDGLKLQFYAKKDDVVIALAETKNKLLMFSTVGMGSYQPTEPITLQDARVLLEKEMAGAPWKNREVIEQLVAEFKLDATKVKGEIPIFAFLTGTIRNYWELQPDSERAVMNGVINDLLKSYAKPWVNCLPEGKSSSPSYFIPQAREGEFEFIACTTIYQQLDQNSRAEKHHLCVASFGIGAGSCQWMTKASSKGLHAISLDHGMKTTGSLPHLLSKRILDTYDSDSAMLDDFLTSIENALAAGTLPVIALKSGCLITLTEVNCCKGKGKPSHGPNNNELISKLFLETKELEPIRVFYQHKDDPTNKKVSSSLVLAESWLGASGRKVAALQSRICADAAKALGVREQFFCIECTGRDGINRILENDSTIVVSTAEAAWFAGSRRPSTNEWVVYGSKAVGAQDWDDDDRRDIMIHTKSSFDLQKLANDELAGWWDKIPAARRSEIQHFIAAALKANPNSPNHAKRACMAQFSLTASQYHWIIDHVPAQKVLKSQ